MCLTTKRFNCIIGNGESQFAMKTMDCKNNIYKSQDAHCCKVLKLDFQWQNMKKMVKHGWKQFCHKRRKKYRKTKTLFKCSKAKLCLQFEPPRNTFKFQKHYMCVLHVKNKGKGSFELSFTSFNIKPTPHIPFI